MNQHHFTYDLLVNLCSVVLSPPQIFDSQTSFSEEQHGNHPRPCAC